MTQKKKAKENECYLCNRKLIDDDYYYIRFKVNINYTTKKICKFCDDMIIEHKQEQAEEGEKYYE